MSATYLKNQFCRGDLFDAAEVMRRTGMTVTEINRAIAEDGFPRPTVGGLAATPFWHRDELEEYLALAMLRGKRWMARC